MKKFAGIGLGVVFLALPLLAFAQIQQTGTTNIFPQPGVTNAPAPASYNSQFKVENPLGNVTSFCGLVKKLLQAALDIGIPIAVLFIVYAGFKFVLAQGSPEKLAEARANMIWTLVGIGIFLGAWLLASVVANTINALQAGSTNGSIISCQ